MAAHQAKGLDPGQAFALAMGQNGEKSDKASGPGGLRLRIMEHNLNLNPVRRRKISVPELSPMTTVHEAAIDSRECLCCCSNPSFWISAVMEANKTPLL